MMPVRYRFGLPRLDDSLGGGLLPGSLTVIAGATGAGKTQLGLHWAAVPKTDHQQSESSPRRGILCDLTSRGDAQNHRAYAQNLAQWMLVEHSITEAIPNLDQVWNPQWVPGDYFAPFARTGRRVTQPDVDAETWQAWKADLARILRHSAHWVYSHAIRGNQRIVIDGIEPTDRFSESIQFEYFEYLYQKLIRQEDEWLARELFRERFRAMANQVLTQRYDANAISCVYLYTTPHILLDDLMAQPIAAGGIFANANTIILMGRTRQTSGYGRALYIAKHRGSACSDEIHHYTIKDRGIVFV